MTDTREIASIALETDGKAKKLVVVIHVWEALANRPRGSISVEGIEGSYQVIVREYSDTGNVGPETVKYTGGLEHALMKAFKLKGRYLDNGLNAEGKIREKKKG